MSVYDATGRPETAFVDISIAGKIRCTFVASSAALAPPLSSGPAFARVERTCTIKKVSLLTYGGTGSCVVDIWKDTYANFPPVVGDSITAAAKPTISSGVKSEDSVLTGWNKSLTEGDVLAFNLDSSSTFRKVVVELEVE